MLAIYIVVVLMLAGYPTQGGIIPSISSNDNQDAFQEFLKGRCMKNADMFDMKQHAKKLNVKALCMEIDSTLIGKTDDENTIREQCEEWTDKVEKCFDTTIDLIQSCFISEESYIPEFARESSKAYLKNFCADPKLFTITELLETNTAKCINRFAKHKETDPQKVCFATMKLLDSSENSTITKTELCSELDTVYSCYETRYKEYCSDSPKAWEFQRGLLNALRSPCQ